MAAKKRTKSRSKPEQESLQEALDRFTEGVRGFGYRERCLDAEDLGIRRTSQEWNDLFQRFMRWR